MVGNVEVSGCELRCGWVGVVVKERWMLEVGSFFGSAVCIRLESGEHDPFRQASIGLK